MFDVIFYTLLTLIVVVFNERYKAMHTALFAVCMTILMLIVNFTLAAVHGSNLVPDQLEIALISCAVLLVTGLHYMRKREHRLKQEVKAYTIG